MWVLIGIGANQLEIPALVWSSKETALTKCRELFGETFDAGASYEFDSQTDDASRLYTYYYGGCGECYAVILKEVAEGMPFVAWDLD